MQDPRFCSACGAGPFMNVQNHLNKCRESKRRETEFMNSIHGIKRHGPTLESEIRKRRQPPDLVPHIYLSTPEDYTIHDDTIGQQLDSSEETDEAALFHALEESTEEHPQVTTGASTSGGLGPANNPDGLRHGERVRRPTWKVIQAELEAVPVHVDFPEPPTLRPTPHVRLLVRPTYSQNRDVFGLSRSYKGVPSSIPDNPGASSYIPGYSHPNPHKEPRTIEEIVSPYPNLSSFLFDHHFWTGGSSKSRNDRDVLQAVVTRSDFDPDDIKDTKFRQIEEELRGRSSRGNWEQERGWRTSKLYIGIPTGEKQTAAVRRENAAHQARVQNAPHPPLSATADLDGFPIFIGNFHHRSICEIIRETFSQDPAARTFHYHPYEKTYHSPVNPTATMERVYDELYTSDTWIREDAKVQTIKLGPSITERDLPRAIAAIMLWSDETVLNPFGQNKAWPVYIFGNQPKRERSAPTAGGGRHLAYLPDLPDKIQDKIKAALGKAASRAHLTHCRREVFQAAWLILIQDPKFLDAYVNGMIVECIDGIKRRLFPRFFIYSADYPEKVMIATIRDYRLYPCHRCLILKEEIFKIGRDDDRRIREESRRVDTTERQGRVEQVRTDLYKNGYALSGDHVDGALKKDSLVPTKNAFSQVLFKFGFDFFKMLTVDLLHEYELGLWRDVSAHIVRILEFLGADKVQIFDERFRQVPVFGETTIRRFDDDVSEMKRLAGHDFEDILQCIIPCLEGLLPEPHNTTVLDLIFLLATWHALAKMGVHTDTSLHLLDTATTALGAGLRYFVGVTCPKFNTVETTSEYSKRRRRQTSTSMPASSSTTPPRPAKPYRDAQLIHAGKGYGLMYSIWARFRDIIERGSCLTETNPLLLSPLDRGYREGYLNLLCIEPKISDLVAERPLTELASQLEKGRNEFRNSQVHSIRDLISGWGFEIPDDGRLRGFGDDVCGRLLCPSTQDWENPMIREQIRSFQIPVTADDFPRFLWEGERVTLQDMNKGFLRGELLVKTLLAMLIGPTAARPGNQSSGAGGYADLLNLQTMTFPSLAFAATVVRHALSAESTCRWVLKSNSPGFNNLAFYQRIISTVESWRAEEQRSLLLWWNRTVLSHVRGGVHATPLNDTPAPGSAAAMMLQQATGTDSGPH